MSSTQPCSVLTGHFEQGSFSRLGVGHFLSEVRRRQSDSKSRDRGKRIRPANARDQSEGVMGVGG